MKKLLLLSALVSSFYAQSQCTPGANFADSTFGVWPDTTTNFPPAFQGVFYSTDLNFKVPLDAGDVLPALAGNTIQSFTVTDVAGLPPGMSYTCNVSSCTYNGGVNGCAQVTGTCNTLGTYDITINVEGIVNLQIIGPTPVPYSFVGYKIVVGVLGQIEAVINPLTIHPNPANDHITVAGLNPQMKISSLYVTNADGKKVKDLSFTNPTVDMDLNGFDAGIYFVVINNAAGTQTYKFIKE